MNRTRVAFALGALLLNFAAPSAAEAAAPEISITADQTVLDVSNGVAVVTITATTTDSVDHPVSGIGFRLSRNGNLRFPIGALPVVSRDGDNVVVTQAFLLDRLEAPGDVDVLASPTPIDRAHPAVAVKALLTVVNSSSSADKAAWLESEAAGVVGSGYTVWDFLAPIRLSIKLQDLFNEMALLIKQAQRIGRELPANITSSYMDRSKQRLWLPPQKWKEFTRWTALTPAGAAIAESGGSLRQYIGFMERDIAAAKAFLSKHQPPSSKAVVKIVRFKNCAALRAKYPHGVARAGYIKTANDPRVAPIVSTALYRAQSQNLDRDRDGIACE